MAHPWGVGIVLGLIAIPMMRPCFVFEPDPPAITGKLPAFSLVDTDSRSFGSAELLGKVWVASFSHTRAGAADTTTAKMKELQDRYAAAGVPVELVTFTVDPTHDTSERLAAHAATVGADPERWHFLTGTEAAVDRVVAEGFRSFVDRSGERIAHSPKMVLVDPHGHIRGYYPSSAAPEHLAAQVVDELFWRAQHVLEAAGLKR